MAARSISHTLRVYDGLRDNAVGERHYVAIQWCHRSTN